MLLVVWSDGIVIGRSHIADAVQKEEKNARMSTPALRAHVPATRQKGTAVQVSSHVNTVTRSEKVQTADAPHQQDPKTLAMLAQQHTISATANFRDALPAHRTHWIAFTAFRVDTSDASYLV